MIVVADADGPEEPAVFRVLRHVAGDSLPEQHQRRMALLILVPHEGATELDGIVEAVDESALVLEQ